VATPSTSEVPGTETVAVTLIEMCREARFANVAVLVIAMIEVSIVVVTPCVGLTTLILSLVPTEILQAIF
jgi:hypothetical protein